MALAVVMLAAGGAAGCGAGIQAETSRERPTINSVGAAVGNITVRNIYVGGPGQQGGSVQVLFAAYNGGTEPDQLTGVSSPVAAQATAPAQVSIAPGQGTIYNPGTGAPRLTGLRSPLLVAQQVQLTLTFQRAGSVTVEAPVEPVPGAGSSASSPAGAPAGASP